MGVERAKVELSRATVARIVPDTLLLDELGIAIPIEVELTREQFEATIMPLVERSIKICYRSTPIVRISSRNGECSAASGWFVSNSSSAK